MRDSFDQQTQELTATGIKIGYARVSTHDQSLSLQQDSLKEAGCEQIYAETTGGAADNRQELNNALKSLRPGDTLVVWRLDRLGRSMKNLIDIICDLDARGVCLESLTENIDTSTATGRLMTHVFGVLAEFEKNLIRERTIAGLKSAKSRGRSGGRPKVLSKKAIKEIERLLSDPELNLSAASVAERYGISRSTLYRYVDVEKIREQSLSSKIKEAAE